MTVQTVITSSTNPGPAITNTGSITETPQTSQGFQTGQSTTDQIGFYGTAPLAQQANTVDAITQLVNLGLLPAGSEVQTNGAVILAGSTLTLTNAQSGRNVALNTLTGSVVTLPAATGSGDSFLFYVSVVNTSNSHKVKVANASDFMIGQAQTEDSATVTGYVCANSGTVTTNSDTITFNGTTTGGLSVGDRIEVIDVSANTWLVQVQSSSSGTAATPFSAAV